MKSHSDRSDCDELEAWHLSPSDSTLAQVSLPPQFARLTADFSSFVDLAQRWAERDALRNATEYIRRQAFSEIDRSRYQLRESDIADLSSFNELVSFWDEFGYALPEILLERNWYRYVQQLDKRGRANLSPLAPLVGPPSLESFAPELFSAPCRAGSPREKAKTPRA